MTQSASYNLNSFSGPDVLASALASSTAATLRRGIARNGSARLVVSGGRTPIGFFHALSHLEINWAEVTVMLADERWVPQTDPRSNSALVCEHLLQNNAEKARFISYYLDDKPIQQAAQHIAWELAKRPVPLDVVILGLGTDGHTASLFPDAPEISAALASDAPPAMAMHPPSQPEARLTLTATPLSQARFLALHIEGAQKHLTLEKAAKGGVEAEMPVRAILKYFCFYSYFETKNYIKMLSIL